MLTIEIADEQAIVAFDAGRIRRASEAILLDAGIEHAQLSIAIVDDATIHELNRRYLDHDSPTDVLSFVLEAGSGQLEGEVIASAETAAREAVNFGWSADDELLLYVIHGTLHLVGHDDRAPESRAAMRQAERRYLALVGLKPRCAPTGDAPTAAPNDNQNR
jgi:probable rRNA maturation factor